MMAAFLIVAPLLCSCMVAGKQISLLHQNAMTASGALTRHGRPVNPKPSGHMLTNTELRPVNSVRCLEGKQEDPTYNCSGPVQPGIPSARLNAGNYPSWKDARCHSGGEYFCDPDDLLSPAERKQLAATMKSLREGQKITCGPQLQHDPVDKWHYDPFYLGVAIAKDWPLHESDAHSLQSFGQILAGRWNMTYPWDGNPAFYARCPNAAMLILLPEKRQAVLSSSSCMFICEDKGAPEVATAALLGLDSKGLLAGVTAGMSEVYKVLSKTSPMHKQGWEPAEETAGTWTPWNEGTSGADGRYANSTWQQNLWNYSQRFLFVFAALLLIFSVVVALLVCCLAPGKAASLNKSVV